MGGFKLDVMGGANGRLARWSWSTDSHTAPSLNLTPEEKRVFGQLFREADTDGLGVVTGEVAVKFFEKTRLEPRVLGEVRLLSWSHRRDLLSMSAIFLSDQSWHSPSCRYGRLRTLRIEGCLRLPALELCWGLLGITKQDGSQHLSSHKDPVRSQDSKG